MHGCRQKPVLKLHGDQEQRAHMVLQRTQYSESMGSATGVNPRTPTLRPCTMQSPPGAARAGGAGGAGAVAHRQAGGLQRVVVILSNRRGFTRSDARTQVVLAEDVLGGAGEVVAIKVLRRQYAYAGQKARPAPALGLHLAGACERAGVGKWRAVELADAMRSAAALVHQCCVGHMQALTNS